MKIGDRWIGQAKNANEATPRTQHPIQGRHAVLYVSRNGTLTLAYQNEAGAWHTTLTSLNEWSSSDELLTYAAMGDEAGYLMLVTYDQRCRFRIYGVTINWNTTQQSKNNTNFVSIAPVLDIRHLTILDGIMPQQGDAKLSVLKVLPKVPDSVPSEVPIATTILAVFTSATLHQAAFSVIARWYPEAEVPVLHECFSKTKGNAAISVEQLVVTRLKRQEDILTAHLPMTCELYNHATTMIFGNSDGTAELRERSTWTAAAAFGDTSMASSLSQSSLTFDNATAAASTPDCAVNANGGFMIYEKPNGQLDTRYVTLRYGWQTLHDGISDTKAVIEAAIICLAREFAILCGQNAASDEILALLPPDISPDLRVLFLKQTFRTMCRVLDVSMLDQSRQQSVVLRESIHLRPLSAQMVLGTKSSSQGSCAERTFAGQFAYVYLNMRLISMAFAQSFQASNRTAELVHSLAGLVRWTNDLQFYMVDTLLELHRLGIETGSEDVTTRLSRTISETGNPTLHLLLCGFPRVLLRMQSAILPTYYKWIQVTLQQSRELTIAQRQDLEDLFQRAKDMPFLVNQFSELVTDFDGAVRNAYQEAGTNSERRTELEISMMTEGTIPEELQPAVSALFQTILPKLRENTDEGKLYFWDTEWLGISTAVPEKQYDAIRKVPLTRGMKLRRCRRCGAEMGDIPADTNRQGPDWLRNTQRHCFCQGAWWPLG
ncbi:hypothetical protein BAUCODRAFT_162532 [Baudoinia panamericana UAMH 10762]|uniref:Mediator of RNA polymerase II transcription subunit 16 n=1 Tax=Baudoinia panamericana (strain UAMH 10762) TaxID=717646 RepID=M2N8B7_BAUPA|nr:uncharacterized protein BAUCODRAFT_162532 [Baudoinia panamericana UAMH 10762]EMD00384.1 hypothetical protein BAUCODRAFT_162532 [Baudoinia panamericana UAMH 10762]